VQGERNDFQHGASLDVAGLALFDYFNLNNALSDGNAIDATVSYSIQWSEDGTPLTIDDGANFHFSGRQTKGFITWSATESGFSFESDPANTTVTNFALVGRERNGRFYHS
jgi:hypothetical protein